MPEWIPCSERLPDNWQGVLVCRTIAFRSFVKYVVWHDNDPKYKDVTHWMPLPEPPLPKRPMLMVPSWREAVLKASKEGRLPEPPGKPKAMLFRITKDMFVDLDTGEHFSLWDDIIGRTATDGERQEGVEYADWARPGAVWTITRENDGGPPEPPPAEFIIIQSPEHKKILKEQGFA